jgi:DUF1680 family protein
MMRIAGPALHVSPNAGLASSRRSSGWEAPRSELRGHTTGHYLSACALLAASAGDAEIKARGDEMVAELARCQNKLASGGYLSAFPLEFFDRLDKGRNVWAPFYTYHKILAGVLDMYFHAGNKQALEVARAAAGRRWTLAKPHAAILRSWREW